MNNGSGIGYLVWKKTTLVSCSLLCVLTQVLFLINPVLGFSLSNESSKVSSRYSGFESASHNLPTVVPSVKHGTRNLTISNVNSLFNISGQVLSQMKLLGDPQLPANFNLDLSSGNESIKHTMLFR